MSGMVRLGLQDCQKHRHLFLPPGVVLPVPGWEGTPDHSLLNAGSMEERGRNTEAN